MNDWLNIKGKTVLVTGASSGIGKAIVEELLELGVNVANFDLSDNDLRHPNLLFVKVDVTSRSEVEEGVAKIVERFGNIDAVVNNAGINVPRLLIDAENPKGPYELDDETFEKVTELRRQVAAATTPAEAMKASDALTRQVSGIFAVAESYPDLKASTNFVKLQEELTNTENKISYSRQLYNSVVSNYNVKLETFPSNIIAGMFGFKAADFLQTPEEEKAVPKVDFSGLGD